MQPSLAGLHERLRSLENGDADGQEIESIKEQIRTQLPAVGTARSLPQKKTPSGRTNVLHMNYMHSQTDPSGETEIEHLRFFARTVKELGLRLEILTDEGCREELEQELSKESFKALDYTLVIAQKPVSKWAEDSVEYLQNGQVAVLSLFDDDLLELAMKAGRQERWQGKVSPETLAEVLRDDHLWILLGTRVNALKTSLEREYAAQVRGQQVGYIRAYIEGGNMITGEDAVGNPVILIGKDAIASTAYMYQIDDDDVRRILCEDFGLESIEQVICVEQPGKFHLDMGMLFIGKGVVIVNDSRKALKDAIEMAELAPCLTTERMAAKLQLQCSLEDDAAKDLQTAGLQVWREKLEDNVFYNFFNGEFVEGADGFSYYITNGGLQDQEERFEALMIQEWNVVKKVFFSPQDTAQRGLQERGGVGCRLKGARL
ncbi:hypothetical protein IXB50_09295 [Leptothoe spongobia TAU-MAC 1115]|uniref:Arginine deiminase n=2 Tax=Leptothoe TaxID=2651725 RepID=A0A947DFB4_9CYAN|nr:hypothetical protein [Leptothoe spongobia TAU-MAC 1115]